MAVEIPLIIRVITSKLPFDLANLIYNEYEGRYKDALYLLYQTDRYVALRSKLKTVELLLALSIFYKRVISNLDAAAKFHKNVSSTSDAKIVKVGTYELDDTEKNKILRIVIAFRKLKEKYQIEDFVFEYNETREFLNNIAWLQDRRRKK